MTERATEQPYVMGHSAQELDRLAEQAEHVREQSEQLLRTAGLAPGMRVLDVGTGPGDLAILAARMVGPQGAVVGLDHSPEVIALAQLRAAHEGMANVHFEACDITALGDASELPARITDGPFDALVGRFILKHLPGPAAVLRRLIQHVAPSGIVAFQELDVRCTESDPSGALFRRNVHWLSAALQFVHVDPCGGAHQARIFREAGLPVPRVMLTAKIESATPDAYIFRYMAETTRTLLPVIVRAGIASAEEVGIETLEERLRDEALQGDSTLINVGLVGAYCRLNDQRAVSFIRYAGSDAK